MMSRCLAALALAALSSGLRADDFFEAKIRPVLADACAKCHGAKRASGGLRVDTRAALLKGGDSGPAIIPGQPHPRRCQAGTEPTECDLGHPISSCFKG